MRHCILFIPDHPGPANRSPNGQHNHPERAAAAGADHQHVGRRPHAADAADVAGGHRPGGRRTAADVHQRQRPAVHRDTGRPGQERQSGEHHPRAEHTGHTYSAEYTRWVENLGE